MAVIDCDERAVSRRSPPAATLEPETYALTSIGVLRVVAPALVQPIRFRAIDAPIDALTAPRPAEPATDAAATVAWIVELSTAVTKTAPRLVTTLELSM